MVFEVGSDHAVKWMAPTDADETLVMNFAQSKKLNHVGGTNAVFVNGAARFLISGILPTMLRALISIAANGTMCSRTNDVTCDS